MSNPNFYPEDSMWAREAARLVGRYVLHTATYVGALLLPAVREPDELRPCDEQLIAWFSEDLNDPQSRVTEHTMATWTEQWRKGEI